MYKHAFILLSMTVRKTKVSIKFVNVNLVIILIYIDMHIICQVFIDILIFSGLEETEISYVD